jgi:hypothetical protein
MLAKAFQIGLPVLLAAAMCGQAPDDQSVERIFHLTNISTLQSLQEIATILRTVADVRNLSVDQASTTLTIHGTTEQAVMSEWLTYELDRPATAETVDQRSETSGIHEFRTNSERDDLLRVFYLTNAMDPQRPQEILTAIRKATSLERAYVSAPQKALVARGGSERIEIAGRLFAEQTRP